MQQSLAIIVLAVAVLARPPSGPEMQGALSDLIEEVDTHLKGPKLLKFVEKFDDTKVVSGERVVLRCEVTATPAAVLQWFFNGKLVQGDRHLNVMEKLMNAGKKTVESGIISSQYVIPCANAAEAGVYKCVAFNGHQQIENEAQVVVEGDEAVCKSSHRSSPVITMWTDSRFETEGNTATLVCRAHSATKHSISWETEEGEMINSLGSKFEVQDNGDLMIRNIRWADMGTYYCIASNKYGEARAETFLYPTSKKQ